MKKVKLTTITLALIASSAVAPLAANAEEVVSFDAVTEEGTAAEVVNFDEEGTLPETVVAITPLMDATPAYKTSAKEKTAAAVTEKIIDTTKQQELDDKIDAAKTEAEVDAIIAEIKAELELVDAKKEVEKKIDELATANALTPAQVALLKADLAAAKTADEIKAVENSLAAATALKTAKDAAVKELDAMAAAGANPTIITDAKAEVALATTVKEVEAIVAKAKADAGKALDFAGTILRLANLRDAGKITEADYYNYVALVNNSTTAAELDNIVAEASNIQAARKAANDKLLEALAAGKITKVQYDIAKGLIDSALTQAAIDAILANYGIATPIPEPKPEPEPEPKPKPKPEPGKDKEDEGKAPGTDDNSKAPDKVYSGGKPAVVTTAAKATLPQTGEELNGSIVAGGLMSMLTAAFLFFRRDRKAD